MLLNHNYCDFCHLCGSCITCTLCLFILQMDVLNKFVKQLVFSDDSNFKSAGENLETVVSTNVSLIMNMVIVK